MEEDELAADDNPTKAYEVCRLPYPSTTQMVTLCPLLQLYCKRKAELILKQSQLAERGAPTMVLLVITAFKGELRYDSVVGWVVCECPPSPLLSAGEMCPVVHSTLRLGIALLKEGNQKIQHVRAYHTLTPPHSSHHHPHTNHPLMQEMLEQLKSMDVGYLQSIAKLISSCR